MPSIRPLKAFDLHGFIEDHREELKPPVGNKLLWDDGEMMCFVIGGPNIRSDYHVDPMDEFFHQVEGDMTLRIMEEEGQEPVDIPIREGEVFFLPAHTRHSPQRPEGTIGLVIEPARPEGEMDAFEWYCPRCYHLVHRAELDLTNIVTDLPPIFKTFNTNQDARTCPNCGHVHPI